jgi:hypothetical protein
MQKDTFILKQHKGPNLLNNSNLTFIGKFSRKTPILESQNILKPGKFVNAKALGAIFCQGVETVHVGPEHHVVSTPQHVNQGH